MKTDIVIIDIPANLKRLVGNFKDKKNFIHEENITGSTYSLQLEMTKVFYGSFVFSLTTTFVTTLIVFSSDFLARHVLIHFFFPFTGFTLTICSISAGIKVISKRRGVKRLFDIMLLFFTMLHMVFTGYILLAILIYRF